MFFLLTHYSISKTCASPVTCHSRGENSVILTKPCPAQKHLLKWVFAWTWKEDKKRGVLKGRKLGECSCTHFFPWPVTVLTLFSSLPVQSICSRRQGGCVVEREKTSGRLPKAHWSCVYRAEPEQRGQRNIWELLQLLSGARPSALPPHMHSVSTHSPAG